MGEGRGMSGVIWGGEIDRRRERRGGRGERDRRREGGEIGGEIGGERGGGRGRDRMEGGGGEKREREIGRE